MPSIPKALGLLPYTRTHLHCGMPPRTLAGSPRCAPAALASPRAHLLQQLLPCCSACSVHERNVDDLMLAALPYHETEQFVRLVQVRSGGARAALG